MYLDWANRDCYVIDIETDDLDATVVWVMCWVNVKTGEEGVCTSYEQINEFFERTSGATYIGHNILKFDAPVLVRLCRARLRIDRLIDTLVVSQLYSPNIVDGHSLEAWGNRLGEPKGDFNDWSHLSQEMIDYCLQDCRVTRKLFLRLMKTMARIGFSEQSFSIQHRWTPILDRQQRNGFYFDGPRAIEFYQMLRGREKELEKEIHAAFPPKLELINTYRKAFKKDGSPTAGFVGHSETFERIEVHQDGSYSAFDYVPFSIGSPQQRTAKLLELGWKPEEFTPKTDKGGGGNPTPFIKGKMAPSLERFLENTPTPEVALISKWMQINGRGNMVNTWLDNWNEDDSCIHGKLFIADTLRLRHQAPNTANIPAVRVKEDKDSSGRVVSKHVLYGEEGYYTYEARDLWVARPGRVLVGTDAAGLELRMLAHYLNRPDFTDQVVNGDPHQYNADLTGIPRPKAKTLLYAIQYGAAAPKVASIMDVSVKEGAKVRAMFLERLGLKGLIEVCQREQEQGRVSLVDGSHVVCPSPHAALNYKLQGGGARVMAAASIILEGTIRRQGFDSLKVGDIHDEFQYDVDPAWAEPHARAGEESIRQSGELLRLDVPLAGTSKIGKTWAETH